MSRFSCFTVSIRRDFNGVEMEVRYEAISNSFTAVVNTLLGKGESCVVFESCC